MNTSEVPEDVLEAAMSIVYARTKTFPEDKPFSLGDDFQLRLFIREDEFRYQTARIYRVVDGVTDTQDFVQIWDQHIVDDEYKQFQQEQDIQMEADWLASREEAVDRALNVVEEIPEDMTLDDLPFDFLNDLEPLGLTYSRLNPHGVFTSDGRQIGSTCNCEDYPCCGH